MFGLGDRPMGRKPGFLIGGGVVVALLLACTVFITQDVHRDGDKMGIIYTLGNLGEVGGELVQVSLFALAVIALSSAVAILITCRSRREVARHRRTEEALRDSEGQFRRFTKASGYGFVMGKLNGELVFGNAATLRIVEEESEEAFANKTFYQYYTAEDAERLKQEILPIVLEKGLWEGELSILSSKGNLIAVEQNIFLIRDEQGTPHMVGNIITDITHRKQAEAELAKAKDSAEVANRTKDCFLANMSHEIRTPMTVVLGYVDMISDGCARRCEFGRQRMDHHAEIVRRNGDHLLAIINDMLDISKIESGKITVERTECSPCRIVADVASLMRPRAVDKGLTLDVVYHGRIPETVRTDSTRLHQILINLVGNAIKFTKTGGIRLAAFLVESAGDGKTELCFEITDSGVGISQEQLGKVFKAFTQADETMSRQFGGTGLGLTISRGLVESLGGTLSAKSELGHGSTFRFTIETGLLDSVRMLENAHEAHASAKPIQEKPAAKLFARVLLCEDGPDNQRLIALLLKKAGVDVKVADNGQIGLEKALEARETGRPFDVILMDMQMPVMDGYTATAKLREAGYTDPIVALTAHAMAYDRQKCLDAGCDDYARKPISRADLLATIIRHLKAPREEPVAN